MKTSQPNASVKADSDENRLTENAEVLNRSRTIRFNQTPVSFRTSPDQKLTTKVRYYLDSGERGSVQFECR
ncbi:hypothetical protein DPMN_133374 [Dreissena polymorpha]|uniref:Uncharacterized protein n=1 Tax=Dreissena polymorpha TaxID=45954 RepID=A0A9D4FV31_DREPO|nr:hypothetical protein DPMN_133374 [Dreissena polymorpha]